MTDTDLVALLGVIVTLVQMLILWIGLRIERDISALKLHITENFVKKTDMPSYIHAVKHKLPIHVPNNL